MTAERQTVIEKIISAHSGQQVHQGQIAWVELDVVSARDFGGASVVANFNEAFPGEPVGDSSRTRFTFDCNAPANTIGYAENQHICRLFAREHGIEVYDVNAGIGSHVMIEEGLALPGMTVIGTDSHLNILGAVGCFGQGMGDLDVAYAFRNVRTWFEVPPSVKITLKGNLIEGVSAKDLTLYLVGKFGASGLLGMSAELCGDAVQSFNLSDRITIASMATEMGAVTLFIPPSPEVISEIELMSGMSISRGSISKFTADEDAKYIGEYEIDLSEVKPMIACPPRPDNVLPVEDVAKMKVAVDSVVVGSCTGGRQEDIREFARVVCKHGLAEGVMAKVAPATRRVYLDLMRDGTLEALAETGCVIVNQGCAGCAAGQVGMTGKFEVQVSTGNRNFAGKQGKGETYLAGARTAGFCAARGFIASQ